MATNIYTRVTIGDQTFSIKKFTAKEGLKLARMVISKAAPLIPLLDTGNEGEGKARNPKRDQANINEDQVYEAVGAVLDSMDDKDVDFLVDRCLRVCYLELPAGPAPVIDETGNYGVEDVEYDMSLTIRLIFEAIKWGAADFFGGKNSALSQLMK